MIASSPTYATEPRPFASRGGRVWVAMGSLLLIYAVLGNYVALPGYRRFLERGGTSAAGATFDVAVLIGATKMLVWMFSFQLGVLCLGYAVLKVSADTTTRLRRLYVAGALTWLGVWAIPTLPGPSTAYFATGGCLVLVLIALCFAGLRRGAMLGSPPAETSAGVSREHWRLMSHLCFALATWEVCGLGSVGRMLHLDEARRLGMEPLLATQTTKLMIELAAAWLFAFLATRSTATRTPSPSSVA